MLQTHQATYLARKSSKNCSQYGLLLSKQFLKSFTNIFLSHRKAMKALYIGQLPRPAFEDIAVAIFLFKFFSH